MNQMDFQFQVLCRLYAYVSEDSELSGTSPKSNIDNLGLPGRF